MQNKTHKPTNTTHRLMTTATFCLLFATCTASIAAQPTPLPSTLPTPAPTASPLSFSGRLLDLAHGYVFFSNGDAYQLATNATITDLHTTHALVDDDVTARYGLAIFSPDGKVTHLDVGDKAISTPNQNADTSRFAVVASAPKPNPDLVDHHDGFTGEPVLVVFTVEVPPTTGFNDSIYMSTEASGWGPYGDENGSRRRASLPHFANTRFRNEIQVPLHARHVAIGRASRERS